MDAAVCLLTLLSSLTVFAMERNVEIWHSTHAAERTEGHTDGNGNITDRIEYSLYGLTTSRVGATDTPFLFAGRFGATTDPNGLICMRARYYNPYLCRFLNADPAGFSGGLDLYAYADGNPVSFSDPSGLCVGLGPGYSSSGGWISFATPANTWPAASLAGGNFFGDAASLFVPGYASLSTANAALNAGDYGLAAIYGVKGVAEAGLFIASLGGSEGLNMELNEAGRSADQTYQIMDGVRRTVAANQTGATTIQAEILDANMVSQGVQQVPINSLLSPKEFIDLSGSGAYRWNRVLEGTQNGANLPPIQITPGSSGMPIQNVTIGQP